MDTLSERSIPIPFQRRCALSTSIDLSFVKQFEREVHEAYQRQGSLLRATVRSKNNVKGASTTFQKIGKGVASTKARHGKVTPMNVDHTPVECILQDFYAGDYVDKLDEAKVNHDERMVIANARSEEHTSELQSLMRT